MNVSFVIALMTASLVAVPVGLREGDVRSVSEIVLVNVKCTGGQTIGQAIVVTALKRPGLVVQSPLKLEDSAVSDVCIDKMVETAAIGIVPMPGHKGSWIVVNEFPALRCDDACWRALQTSYTKSRKKFAAITFLDTAIAPEIAHLYSGEASSAEVADVIAKGRLNFSLYLPSLLHMIRAGEQRISVQVESDSDWEISHRNFRSSTRFTEYLLTSMSGKQSIEFAKWDPDSQRVILEFWSQFL